MQLCHFYWLGIKSVVQTFTDEEIEKLQESDIEREIGEINGLLNDEVVSNPLIYNNGEPATQEKQ